MRRAHLVALAGLAACLVTAAPAAAQKKIKVDFSPAGTFKTNDGLKTKLTPSGLTDEQKKAVIKSMQDNYDDAVGPGTVTVEEGKGGDYDVVVSGTKAFRGSSGLYGNSGQPGGPALVFAGTFQDRGYEGEKLTSGIGEAAAHEVFHNISGLTDHNKNDPPDKMSNLTKEQRKDKAGTLKFNDKDKALLKKNLVAANTNPDLGPRPNTLPVLVGVPRPLPGGIEPIDPVLDVTALLSGPTDAEFGYLSLSGDFIFAGDLGTSAIGFDYGGYWDVALNVGGNFYDLMSGAGAFTLSDPNPLHPSVFRHATLQFTTPQGDATLVLDGPTSPGTGGFGRVAVVPEPRTFGLLALGIAALGAAGARRRRATGPSTGG